MTKSNDKSGAADLYLNDVALLALLYGKLIDVLDAKTSQAIRIDDDALEVAYLQLTVLIEQVLAEPYMKRWQETAPELYSTTLGENALEGWEEYLQQRTSEYRAELRRELALKGAPQFAPTAALKEMVDNIDVLVAQHRKEVAHRASTWVKRVTEITAAHGLPANGAATAPEPAKKSAKAPSASVPAKIDIHPLKPIHYTDKTGMLLLSPIVSVSMGRVKKPNGKKYAQTWLTSLLFKNVNSLNNGVTSSTFLGVKYDQNNKKHTAKIRNTVDEINKKFASVSGHKKLIIIQGEKIKVDKSYLLEH